MKPKNKNIIFVTGINTDVGKTYATGLLARTIKENGHSVITQKIIQTGCTTTIPEDILIHRKIMNMKITPEDKNGITCPYTFKLPASPHLSATEEKINIDCRKIKNATDKLLEKYDNIIIEGIGGLYVPLNAETMVIDYIKQNNYPVILVSSPILGSINHTLMSIELLKSKNIQLLGIIYNLHQQTDEIITRDSREIFKKYLIKNNYQPVIIDIPSLPAYNTPVNININAILEK